MVGGLGDAKQASIPQAPVGDGTGERLARPGGRPGGAAKGIETTFTPLSDARKDWLSLNSRVAHALQKVAAKSSMRSFVQLADPAARLASSDPWRALDEVRGEHFHRWRSQSAGMTGAPKSSPWSRSLGSSTMSVGAGRLIGQDPARCTWRYAAEATGSGTLRLNAGVSATEIARRAGHSVAVPLKLYAHCIDGHADAANQRTTESESESGPGGEGDDDSEQAS
jgi:hypothetical protein